MGQWVMAGLGMLERLELVVELRLVGGQVSSSCSVPGPGLSGQVFSSSSVPGSGLEWYLSLSAVSGRRVDSVGDWGPQACA